MRRSSANRRRSSTASRRGPSARSVDVSALRKRELVALVSELQAQNKAGSDLAIDNVPSRTHSIEDVAHAAAPLSTPARVPCLFIDQPVRSGQNIEFDGNVTVVGSVSSGAEIIASGSIFVYGTLRGRALAGTAGDRTARIFCRSFQAELVAIDGRYRLAENLDPGLRGRPVQARLDGSGMTLTPLD